MYQCWEMGNLKIAAPYSLLDITFQIDQVIITDNEVDIRVHVLDRRRRRHQWRPELVGSLKLSNVLVLYSWFIGKQGQRISCTKALTLPNFLSPLHRADKFETNSRKDPPLVLATKCHHKGSLLMRRFIILSLWEKTLQECRLLSFMKIKQYWKELTIINS